MVISISSRGTLTLPAEIRKKLDVKENDFFDVKIENGEIIITPVIVMPKRKLSEFGIKKEKLASKEINQGEIKSFDNADDLIKELNEN